MRPSTITRRSALALLGTAAAGALAYRGWRQPSTGSAASRLKQAFPQLHAFAQAIKTDPQLRALDDSSSLSEAVFGVAADRLPQLSNQVLIARYGTAVQRDFASGRIVSLAGWVLAETEGRVIALLSTID